MGIQKTEAVLLKKKNLRETSLILTYFTEGFGKLHGVLKGARGARARTEANPLFFSLDQIVFYEKEKSALFIISHCEALKIFLNILKDWHRALAAYYILELVDVFTEQGGKSKEIFDCLLNSLKFLDDKKEEASITRLFEVRFLMALGLWPGMESFNLTKGAASTLARFEKDTWQGCSKIKLTRQIDNEIKKITGKFISGNLERPLNTAKVFG